MPIMDRGRGCLRLIGLGAAGQRSVAALVDHDISDATRRRHAEKLSPNVMINNTNRTNDHIHAEAEATFRMIDSRFGRATLER